MKKGGGNLVFLIFILISSLTFFSAICGNSVCEPTKGEDCSTCPTDCGCGTGYNCSIEGVCVAEKVVSCSTTNPCSKSQTCVNGICLSGFCGDEICNSWETCSTCTEDCGGCSSCLDSDGGLNYYKKGTVQGDFSSLGSNYVGLTGEASDFCIQLDKQGNYPWVNEQGNGNICAKYDVQKCGENCAIYETYCLNGKVHVAVSNCPGKCVDGACIQTTPTCSDSDGGINYYAKGNVTYMYGYKSPIPNDEAFVEDHCSNSTQLQEVYCLVDSLSQINFGWRGTNCSNGCKDGACIGENKKNMQEYSDKEVFLISDKNWRDVLQLIPLTTWTGSETCNKGYGTSNNVCVYPTLIYHEEEAGFDADSLIYFMQQYNTKKVTIVGETPQELDNLLIAQPELGAGINSGNIKRINLIDYLYYWNSYKDVVYVQDDYESALVASTYASLIDVPLVISGTTLDIDSVFAGKNVICVGQTSGRSCNEQYTLEQLQQKYIQETNTDKIILVNPNDLSIAVNEEFQPEKSFNPINEIYSKTSLAAPILASAKHEAIITVQNKDYESVDKFIEQKINSLQFSPEYLTIIASPNAIDMSYEYCSGESCSFYSADAWQYSKIDNDPLLDLAVGRIFGLTISDASSNSARSLFYEETLKNKDKVLVTHGYPAASSAAEVYALGEVLSSIGYGPTVNPNKTFAEEWKNKFFILYHDHGGTSWAGIDSYQIPPLDNSFVLTEACLTCSFERATVFKKDLFCANAIRKGAIGYIGATDESGYLNIGGFFAEVFAQEETIGKAFINAKNSISVYDNNLEYDGMPWYVLLGDPTLKLTTIYKMPKPQLDFVSAEEGGNRYKLIIPAMKIGIPEEIKNLCQSPEHVTSPMYFTTAYNRQFDINYNFCSRINSLFDSQPVAVSPYGWTITKESDINGNKLWISSPFDAFNPLFTTANGNSFTNFEFDIALLNEAPDLIIDEVSLSGHKFSFKVKNIGNKDIINPSDIKIYLGILNCSDKSERIVINSVESCSDYSFYYGNVYSPFVGESSLPQKGYKSLSLDLPEENSLGNTLTNGQMIIVDLVIKDEEGKIIQTNYDNDYTQKVMVVK
jgi:hypothetical protein